MPLPPSRLAGYTLPAREIADGLKQDAAQLSAAVARLAGELKENQESLCAAMAR